VKVRQVRTIPGGFADKGTQQARVVELADDHALLPTEQEVDETTPVTDWEIVE